MTDDPDPCGMVEHDEALREIPAVYERIRPRRAGMASISDAFWRVESSDPERWRHGASALFYVLHEASDASTGTSPIG